MDKLSFRNLIIAGSLILLLAVGFVFMRRERQPQTSQISVGETSLIVQPSPFVQPGTSAASSGQAGGSSGVKLAAPKTQSGIKLLTPQENEKWAIGQLHNIHWNKEAGIVGGIQLIDVQSREPVGWILANTGVKQFSFSWDTRDVFLNRQAGVKVNLKSGLYRIKIVFDERLAPIESAAFNIVSAGEPEIMALVARFRNETINPGVLTVSSGAKIIFVNNDSVKHRISSQTLSAFELLANGGTYILDTSKIPAGTHFYMSDVYSFRAPGTLIVK